MLQRMIEVAFILSTFLVLVVFILAEPVLELLGGPSYRDAAPVLRIQVFALIPVFLGQVLVMGLISVRRPSVQVVANGLAVPVLLVLGVVLIPREGATGAAVRQSSPGRCTPSRSSFSSSRSERSLPAELPFPLEDRPRRRPSAPEQRSSGAARQVAAAVVASVAYGLVLWVTRAIPPSSGPRFAARPCRTHPPAAERPVLGYGARSTNGSS